MTDRLSAWSALLPSLTALLLLPTESFAATKTVTTECVGCQTVAELEQEAWVAAGGAIQNTTDEIVILVVSDTVPISAYFRLVWGSDYVEGYGWYNYPYMETTTVDLNSAIALDNALIARATQIPPIAIPPAVGRSANSFDADVLLSRVSQEVLIRQGLPGLSPWRFLTGAPTAVYVRFRDTRSGVVREVFVGDTITVRFQDGSTLLLKLVDPNSSIQWEVVEGSARQANGEPFAGGPNIIVTPLPPGGLIPVFGGGGTVSFTPIQFCRTDFTTCSTSQEENNGTTTVFLVCTVRYYFAPC